MSGLNVTVQVDGVQEYLNKITEIRKLLNEVQEKVWYLQSIGCDIEKAPAKDAEAHD